jgi:ribosomal protein L3
MAGHMGDVQSTMQGLTVVRVDAERQLLLVVAPFPAPRVPTSSCVRQSRLKGATWNSR